MDEISGQEKFKLKTFLVTMDQLKSALCERIDPCSKEVQRFGVLAKYYSMSAATSLLANGYPHDISHNFSSNLDIAFGY